MRTSRSDFSALAALLVLFTASPLFSQTKQGAVERIKIHAKSLEGNLEGDSPDRDLLVYLPESYRSSGNRRYPVVYMLHGFPDNLDNWWGFKQHFINLPAVLNKAFSDGSTREVMVVMPDSFEGILTDFNVAHTFETYQGDHTNHIADRVELKVIPFFSKSLSFDQPKR